MIHVVNKYIHNPTDNDYYIGRGSILGNPYTSKDLDKTKALYHCDTVEESILSYKKYLYDKITDKDFKICSELNSILLKARETDVYLVCFCKTIKNPDKPCHGDIIKEILETKL